MMMDRAGESTCPNLTSRGQEVVEILSEIDLLNEIDLVRRVRRCPKMMDGWRW